MRIEITCPCGNKIETEFEVSCEICGYKNPKGTVTAIVIQEGRLLVVRRNQEPYVGALDFVGGFMNQEESPKQALIREVKEELGIECEPTLIGEFTGTYTWKDKTNYILSHAFLVELKGAIELSEENSHYYWVPINELNDISFDSNRKILTFIKENFNFDLPRIKELMNQLDPNAIVQEQYLYKAALNGYISKVIDKDELIGFGSIFPRQTMLRKQAVIEDMIVDEKHRGKGYGKQILEDLIKWATDNEMDTIELTTNPKRIAANELYKSVGFKLHITNHYLYNVKKNGKVL